MIKIWRKKAENQSIIHIFAKPLYWVKKILQLTDN
mgnify:CR=1 FL=1